MTLLTTYLSIYGKSKIRFTNKQGYKQDNTVIRQKTWIHFLQSNIVITPTKGIVLTVCSVHAPIPLEETLSGWIRAR